MNGKTLASVSHERDLGIIVSNDLKSYNQCHQAYIKASRVLGMIKRTIQSRNPKLLLPLYKSLVRPHLEYCTPCWSPHYNKDKALLEKVQHRFTHLFSDLCSLTYEDRLDRLHLWSLEERRHRADLIEVYRILHGLSPFTADTFFAVAHDSRTRGHSLKLSRQHCKRDIRLHFFSERVIGCWNRLDETTVSAPSLNSFKSRLANYRRNEKGLFLD
jgi:ribonuclease P/MRP protein subunit RPP40